LRTIIVEDYNPQWTWDFLALKAVYEKKLIDIDCQIIHVGSTSVEGLAAKPIIDVDIVVKTPEDIKKCIQLLEQLGYIHAGQRGIEGRESFDRTDECVPYNGENKKWRDHHLYVCMEGINALENHLKLKAFLQSRPEAVRAYSDLKKELAKKYAHDIDSYIAEKTDLIVGFLQQAGMDEDVLKGIKNQNK